MIIQDYLLETFGPKGYFVEAGAHDGVGDSNTYRLEQVGWTGVCVEPSSAYYGLTLSRKCRTDSRCLYDRDKVKVLYREMDGNAVELSGIPEFFDDKWERSGPNENRTVEAVSLTTLLAEHKAPQRIEFLCLDTEGSEYMILAAHDFSRFRFRTMLVEYNGVDKRRRALADMIQAKGYAVIYDNSIELLFKDVQ